MHQRTATCLLVVVAVALLLATCSVSARPLPPPRVPPVLLGGGDACTWGSFGGRPPCGGTGELGARRLGQRGSQAQNNPPSPKHGPAKTVWVPEPPPPPSVNE